MTFITISKRNKILVSVIGVISILVGYYLAVYKSFSYGSKNDIIGSVIIIFCFAIIEMMWLNMDRYSNKNTFQVTLLTIVGVIVIIGMMFLRNNYLESELSRNGINTIGTVVGFEADRSGRTTRNYAQIKYEYSKNQILQRVEYFDNKYKLNQTLKIIVSKREPEMFKIIELEQ